MIAQLTPLRLAWLAAVTLATAAGCSQKPGPSDEALIRASFEQYKVAALQSDGSAVAPLLTEESLAHYDRLRNLALSGTEAEVDENRYVERMQVWMFRQLLSAEELGGMSSEQLVAYVFDKHMMGEDLEESSAIDSLQIKGATATARHLTRGRPAGGPIREVTFQWKKGSDDQWRLDLLHTVAVMELQFDDIHAMRADLPKDLLAEGIVQGFTKRELEPKHHQPMLVAASGSSAADRKPRE